MQPTIISTFLSVLSLLFLDTSTTLLASIDVGLPQLPQKRASSFILFPHLLQYIY